MSTACLTTTLDCCPKYNTKHRRGEAWTELGGEQEGGAFSASNSSVLPHLSTYVEFGRINDQLNLWGKIMNNVYILIIHGGQPSTQTTAPLDITGSPRQHKLSISFQWAFSVWAGAKLNSLKIQTHAKSSDVNLWSMALAVKKQSVFNLKWSCSLHGMNSMSYISLGKVTDLILVDFIRPGVSPN